MQKKLRAAAVGAALAAALSLIAGGALAQTTTDTDEPGKPLSLLQMLIHHGAASKPQASTPAARPAARSPAHVAAKPAKTEAHTAERTIHHSTHLAVRHPAPARWAEHETAANAAAAPTPAVPWPLGAIPAAGATNDDPPIAAAAFADPAQANPAPAAAEPQVSELVVGGHTVQIVSPDQVNAIDLAADAAPQDQAAATGTRADTKTAANKTAANMTTAQNEDADDEQTGTGDSADAADAQTAPRQVVAFAREADGSNHHPSWLAELLATLGGALAAGSVAWFLIGSAPQRA